MWSSWYNAQLDGWVDKTTCWLLVFIHLNSYSSSAAISLYIVHIVQLAQGTPNAAVLFTAAWPSPLFLSCMHAHTSLTAPSDGKSSCLGCFWHLTCISWWRWSYGKRFEFVKKLWSIWSNIIYLAYGTKPEA